MPASSLYRSICSNLRSTTKLKSHYSALTKIAHAQPSTTVLPPSRLSVRCISTRTTPLRFFMQLNGAGTFVGRALGKSLLLRMASGNLCLGVQQSGSPKARANHIGRAHTTLISALLCDLLCDV